jgi:hypothetical protein
MNLTRAALGIVKSYRAATFAPLTVDFTRWHHFGTSRQAGLLDDYPKK